jgi:catechol 2,3-dioxygenase-like lactoylglutathione lyase family enzyme
VSLKNSTVVPVLAVEDIDRATSFYRDKLGLEVRPFEGDPTSAFVHIGDTRVLLYTSGFKRGETTVASFVVDEFDETIRELRDRGVTFEDYDLPGLKTEGGVASADGMKTAWFKDSEGNILAVNDLSEEVQRRAA